MQLKTSGSTQDLRLSSCFLCIQYLQVVCNEMFQLKRANMVETGPMLHADVFKSGLSHMVSCTT